jgi:cytochrome c5
VPPTVLGTTADASVIDGSRASIQDVDHREELCGWKLGRALVHFRAAARGKGPSGRAAWLARLTRRCVVKFTALMIGLLAEVALGAPPVETSLARGKSVYEERCRLCHDVGLHRAPQPGNRWRWPKPTEENIDRLARRAVCGERVMRPKGTCQTCTLDDIKAAIGHMIEYKR